MIIIEIFNLLIRRCKSRWLFSSTRNLYFNYNSKYLFLYVLENYPEIQPLYVINDEVTRKKLIVNYGEYFIETNSIKGKLKALSCGVWFTSVGLPVKLLFANYKRTVFNLWHGVPLKKIGLLEENRSFIKNIHTKIFYSRNFDYTSITSANLKNVFSEGLGIKTNSLLVLGQPRNDALFRRNEDSWSYFSGLLKHDFKFGNKFILYAPTFRKKPTKLFPFNDIDLEGLNNNLLSRNVYIFIRLHPSEINSRIIDEYKNLNRILFFGQDKSEDITSDLPYFDLLITDYSSIYIDFLLISKPVLFIPYDLEEYTRERGLYFDYNTFTPGPKPKSQREFEEEIWHLLEDMDYFRKERNDVNDFFNEIKTPSSGKNIIEFLKVKLNE